jgi:hypothetical protein
VTDTAVRPARPATATPTFLDRALAATPIVGVALVVVTFYAVEAWVRKTPWVFSDELEWTQISRAIADTGHAARRGEPIYFKSTYPYLIAPAWWIESTRLAYDVIKYVNVIVMTLAAVPSYLLARMLVSKRSALAVALLSVAIPGMFYASSIVPEVLAYPWYALASWLIVRALTTHRRKDVALAVAASLVALSVRSPQLVTVSISFALAAAWLWLTGPRGRAFRADWSRSDTLGAVVLLVGAFILVNRVVLQHVEIWQVTTQYWKGRMWDLGLRAGLAFVVGMGVLPVLAALASLHLPDRRDDPVYRAFRAYFAASLLAVCVYAGLKAAYLSTVFSTLTEERNMIYLAPLVLVGAALVFESRRIDPRLVVGAIALLLFVLLTRPFELGYPYFEAPGFGILAMANRHLAWDSGDLRLALVVALAASVAAIWARRLLPVAAVATTLVLAWMLTAEITTTAGSVNQANAFLAHLPKQLDWVDRASGGKPVTYLGQQIRDPNGLWLTEFWNRSIDHVYSLDGSAPGPGPTLTPNVDSPVGELSSSTGDPYTLADSGVDLQAPVVATGRPYTDLRLFSTPKPWRLKDARQGVDSDGWAGPFAGYTYFVPAQRGELRIALSRTGYRGDAPKARAEIRVGTVKILDGAATIGRVTHRTNATVRNGERTLVRVPVARTPVRVEVTMSPTFHASASDPRDLGAQAGFEFSASTPRKRR